MSEVRGRNSRLAAIVFRAGLLIALSSAGSLLRAQDDRAILTLTVNEVGKGTTIVRLRGDDILIEASELDRVGLRGFAGRRQTIDGEVYVSLTSLRPGVLHEFDDLAAALRLTAQPAFLRETILELRPTRPRGVTYVRETSSFLNYSIGTPERGQFSLLTEAGYSFRGNLLANTFTRDPNGRLQRSATSLTLDNRDRMRRIVLGDTFANSGNLGGSLQISGLSVSRNFGLDPYYIRQPSPTLSGAATVPSELEVYINDTLVRRESLPPGPFELRNLPVTAGQGQVRLILRDAFGRVQEVQTPYYLASQVLGREISEYNYHVGFQRDLAGGNNWGVGGPAFMAQHRYGYTDSMTAGFRLEGSGHALSGGPSAAARLPFGEVDAAAALSRAAGSGGGSLSVGYSYLGHPLGFSGVVRATSGRYATLSLKPEEDRATFQTNLSASISAGSRARFTVQHTTADFRDQESERRFSVFSTIGLASRASLLVSASHVKSGIQPSRNELLIGVSYALGGNRTLNVSRQQVGRRGAMAMELQQALPVGEGIGYRVQTDTKQQGRVSGLAQYNGSFGSYEAELTRAAGKVSRSLRVSGGIVGLGGRIHLTRPVQDSFALIRLPGVPNVRGYASNQQIGKTNNRGELLVPNMLSYYGNSIRIRADDLPFNYTLSGTENFIAPTFRGGAVVEFPVQRVQSLTGILAVDVSGMRVVPANGQLTVTTGSTLVESPLGMEGEFYLENLPPGRYPALIEYKDGTCRFFLEVPASDQPFVDLGTQRCAVPDAPETTEESEPPANE